MSVWKEDRRLFFFFQAEDGIRDHCVTGVQTCALPISQVAGGVPAMCDGVTQGQPGMELSLFSRDVIAMAAGVALSHDMFDAAVFLGICEIGRASCRERG